MKMTIQLGLRPKRIVTGMKGLLHWVFMIFLFNTENELMLQQIRCSNAKIIFPGDFTNTCCSRPWSNTGELEENDANWSKKSSTETFKGWIRNSHERGSSRRNYLTQIHHKAQSDGNWGEHEIDSFCLWGRTYFWFQSPVGLRAIVMCPRKS